MSKKFEPKKEKIVKYYSSPAPIFEVYGIEKTTARFIWRNP